MNMSSPMLSTDGLCVRPAGDIPFIGAEIEWDGFQVTATNVAQHQTHMSKVPLDHPTIHKDVQNSSVPSVPLTALL
jgi:hypothetical protein